MRDFVTGGFVQQDIEIWQGDDDGFFTVHSQALHGFRPHFGFGVALCSAVDLYQRVLHEPLALPAAADALGLEVFDEIHFIWLVINTVGSAV